jgi:hypothetical protein
MQRLFGSAVLVVLFLAAPAAAQPPEGGEAPAQAATDTAAQPEVSQEQREQARDHYRRGKRLLDRNRPEEALEEFGDSYALYPHWATSNAMGTCHDRLGRPNDALRLYQQALREGGDTIPEPQRAEIQQRITALRIQLGIPETTTGTIRVSTSPAGAVVRLDGNDAGVSPINLDVPPGAHRIDVSLDGYEPAGIDVDVVLGETVQAPFALAVARAVVPDGRLLCGSDPDGARVVIDGSEMGFTPLTIPVFPSGDHVVRFELDDGRSMQETVTVPAEATARVDVSFGGTVDSGWFWGVAGTALALGAGAAGTGAYGTILWDEFNNPGTTSARQEEIQPLGRNLMLSTDVLASAAGAAAVVALVLALVTDWGGGGEFDVAYEGPAEPAAELPPLEPEPLEPAPEAGEPAAFPEAEAVSVR